MSSNTLNWITAILECLLGATENNDERSLFDGSKMIGDMNHRINRMDCGQDAGGFYEDDL